MRKSCFCTYFYISTICSFTDRPKDKICTEYMLIDKRNVHRKSVLYLNQGRRHSFLFYFYISAFCSLTDRPKDKICTEYMLIYKMDINVYRVASLIKIVIYRIVLQTTAFRVFQNKKKIIRLIQFCQPRRIRRPGLNSTGFNLMILF